MIARLITALALCAAALAQAAGPVQKTFSSPEEGASALIDALKANDDAALHAILGPRGVDLLQLRPQAEEKDRRERFVAAYATSHRLVPQGDLRRVLQVGEDSWPFPIPLVDTGSGWRFDPQAGEREVLARRIGRNELAAIQVCLTIGDAEHEYASTEWDNDQVLKYTSRFVSTPGRHDGLYWQSAESEPLSPLGPFVAGAGIDPGTGQSSLSRGPYYGYHYRILTRQGKNAKGGAYSYVAHGKMIGGFAVLAYPARYGYSGIKTFLVSQDGEVFEKDLGANTRSIAQKIQSFDPDASWTKPAR